ncbi:hypothetical protein O4H53_08175 [Sulfitobacter sp. G21635-S1]|nr:hypothetical protein [Sulfitobacter sp. G21635-S1]MCZ4255507.1 hypothetical protein [Sulfitobacter sp. G21635-S1]
MAKAEHPVTAYANHVLGGKILGGARTSISKYWMPHRVIWKNG